MNIIEYTASTRPRRRSGDIDCSSVFELAICTIMRVAHRQQEQRREPEVARGGKQDQAGAESQGAVTDDLADPFQSLSSAPA